MSGPTRWATLQRVAHLLSLPVAAVSPLTLAPMRTFPLAILGAPFASWALYGCLAGLGAPSTVAVVLAALWGAFWLAVVHLGPTSKLFRKRLGSGARGTPGGRGTWSGAVLCSLFVPIPIYALATLLEWADVAAAPLTLPLLAMLAVPFPGALWWMLLWPSSTDREGEIIHPLGWRRYTPHAPSAVVPPRKGGESR